MLIKQGNLQQNGIYRMSLGNRRTGGNKRNKDGMMDNGGGQLWIWTIHVV
jgi:hypothetical protein